MEGEGPTYAAQRIIQPSQEDQHAIHFTREGPVHHPYQYRAPMPSPDPIGREQPLLRGRKQRPLF
jgi:hypothetical protein